MGGCIIPFIAENKEMDTPVRLGNVYDEKFGQSFGGGVWDTDGVAPTLKTTAAASQQHVVVEEPQIVASRGRGEENDQQLEVQKDGVANTLTSAQKDNMVLEPTVVGGLGEMNSNGGTQYFQHDRVYDSNGVAPAHQAQLAGGSNKFVVKSQRRYRIRKLTPRECFRLMGVKDEDSDKVTVSNSQKYKQAGNSIVVDVLMGIFENMFVKECKKSSLF